MQYLANTAAAMSRTAQTSRQIELEGESSVRRMPRALCCLHKYRGAAVTVHAVVRGENQHHGSHDIW